MTPPALMVFAAGFGTRMGALTANTPKPLIELAGRTLLDHALDLAEGCAPIVINTHYCGDQIAAHVAGRDLLLSPEDPVLETGGGLRRALPLLGAGAVLTLNPDTVWIGPNPLPLLRAAWDPVRMDALLMCVDPGSTHGHGGAGDFDLSDPDLNGVARISRGQAVIYGGAQMICTDRLHHIEEEVFSLNLLWDRMIPDGRAFALRYPGAWVDVGTPEGLRLAEAMLNGPDV